MAEAHDEEASVALLASCGVTEDPLRALRRAHLVTADGEHWTMHRLVRAYARRSGGPAEQRVARDAFLNGCLMRSMSIDVSTGYRIYRADRAHFEQALEVAGTATKLERAATSLLFDRVATGAQSSGELYRARDLFQRAIAIAVEAFDEDAPEVRHKRSNLAGVLNLLGDLEAARETRQRSLDAVIRIHGEDHPEVALERANLASVLFRLGELQSSRDLLEQALTWQRRRQGSDLARIAEIEGALGRTLRELGQLAEARDLLEGALSSTLQHLGEDQSQRCQSTVGRSSRSAPATPRSRCRGPAWRAASTSSATMPVRGPSRNAHAPMLPGSRRDRLTASGSKR